MVRNTNAFRPVTILLIAVISGVFLFPVIITLTNSFMSPFEVTSRYTNVLTPENSFGQAGLINYADMSPIPNFVTLSQYFKLLFETPLYIGLFWNSVILTVPVVLGQLLISVPGAYAFEVSKFKYKEAVFFVYIVVMLMPLQVTLVPNYIVADFLNIQENYLAIILPGETEERVFTSPMPERFLEVMRN